MKPDPFFRRSRIRFRVPACPRGFRTQLHVTTSLRTGPVSCGSRLRGVPRWFTPSACGPGHQELSKSDMDMDSKLLTYTFTFYNYLTHRGGVLHGQGRKSPAPRKQGTKTTINPAEDSCKKYRGGVLEHAC